MIIYIVTDGQYSDYDIKAVFTIKAKAEEYIGRCEGQIEEWEVDQTYAYPPKGRGLWVVYMDKGGDVDSAYEMRDEANVTKWAEMIRAAPMIYKRGRPDSEKELMYVCVLARDQEHAVKIANETRARLIALDQWRVQP